MGSSGADRLRRQADAVIGMLAGNAQTEAQASSQTVAGMVAETESETVSRTLTHSQTYTPSRRKRVRLEDSHHRQTYWMTSSDIQMVDELTTITGTTKYGVVAQAVRELYQRLSAPE